MKEMINIFSKSPFGLLQEHLEKVSECLEEIPTLIQSFIDGDHETLTKQCETITHKEHEADIIKNQIREHLPKSIFMPVSREDLLKLLHRQDNIADACEDLAILLTIRKTPVHDVLKEDLIEFVNKALETAGALTSVTRKIRSLMETTFSGRRAEEVLTLIENIGQLEWETDKKKYKLARKMFEHEKDIDPVSQVMFMKIFDVISSIADGAESTSNALRLMISK